MCQCLNIVSCGQCWPQSNKQHYMAPTMCSNGGDIFYDFSGLAGTPDATDCSVLTVEAAFAW